MTFPKNTGIWDGLKNKVKLPIYCSNFISITMLKSISDHRQCCSFPSLLPYFLKLHRKKNHNENFRCVIVVTRESVITWSMREALELVCLLKVAFSLFTCFVNWNFTLILTYLKLNSTYLTVDVQVAFFF